LLATSRARREAAPRAFGYLHPRAAGPAPCSAAASIANDYGGYTADQLAAYYGMTPLYSLGDFGQSVHVAIAEFEADSPSDIAAYQACYGTSATVNYIPVDGGATPSSDTNAEAALDIEDLIGLAPQAIVDVYQAPSGSNGDVLDVYSTIVDNDTDPVVSTSWGECELDQIASDSSFLGTEQSLFQQAATQGQTVFAAAGDSGSTDCLGDAKSPNQALLAVDDPASQPYVVGVGGTSIRGGSETVWNDASGAGGGGVSSSWCMPTYQDQLSILGLINPDSELADLVPGANCPKDSYMREVPDVSADADPAPGYIIYWDGSWSGTDGYVYGGTSAAAPLWAAAAALIDSSPFCADYGAGDAGVQAQGLYSVASLGSAFYNFALNNITTGNNYVPSSGYSGGLYPATPGYDMASGLGSPHLAYTNNYYPGLAAQMCLQYGKQNLTPQITNVTPNSGPSGQPSSVTITGSGFLPITGADEVKVGTNWITVSCSSTTTCTGTLPATASGTVNLMMSVEDLTVSPVAATDQFTFAAPPVISGISPAVGPEKGGTQVTILGSNFVGSVSVLFGDKTATAVEVISPSELRVAVPSGSGAAKVTVSAVGGSSPTNTMSTYTFLPSPVVTKILPAIGPEKSGTEVTIRGSNFVGVVSVRFGTRLASDVRVLSANEITARTPPGSGTVYVIVSAVGGSGRDEAAGEYRY
jgi:subtilase family serine protease